MMSPLSEATSAILLLFAVATGVNHMIRGDGFDIRMSLPLHDPELPTGTSIRAGRYGTSNSAAAIWCSFAPGCRKNMQVSAWATTVLLTPPDEKVSQSHR